MDATDIRDALRGAAGGCYWGDSPKLEGLVADVLAEVNEIDLSEPYPEDRCHEIADGCVPIYTRDVFDLMPELAGYELSDSGLLPDAADLEKIAQVMVYDILSNVAHQALYARQSPADDDA